MTPSAIGAGQRELRAQRRQRIGGVAGEAIVVALVRHGSDRSTARTGEASACASFSGSAISS